jgi:2-polyprenyl-6-methoxyphenol hydroxylase-like FAD-dependent oxidoreductase
MGSTLRPAGPHALVIGASVAGLLAGRVLADHFERVTIVERDRLPSGPEVRKSVPQGRHIHVLLARGSRLLERFFPGLGAELAAAGATPLDWAADVRWYNFGGWKPCFPSGLISSVASRALIEWGIRRRVAGCANIRWQPDCEATGLVTDPGRTRVTGVRLRPHTARTAREPEVEMAADLVVNAAGRDSPGADWLTGLGYPAPPVTRVNSFLGYASRTYERPAHAPQAWKALILSATPPVSSRGAVIVPLEGGRWLVTLAGAARDYPPTDPAGFLAFARSLPTPLLYDTIKDARPLTDVVGYRRTENLRRHYERLPRFLDGFVAVGDAVCAFNPVYGQGMTLAALGAEALERCLHQQRQRKADGDLTDLAGRFQRDLGRVIDLPWLLSTGEDLRYPTTEGGRLSLMSRWMRPYLDAVLRSANSNPRAHRAFLEVIHLIRPPAALFAPDVVIPVIRHLFAGSGAAP